MNFDGAIFREENSAGVGVIIRDEEGQIIASMAKKVPLPNSIAALEAVVAVKTLYFAAELGISSIVLGRDPKNVLICLFLYGNPTEPTSYFLHMHTIINPLLNTWDSYDFCIFFPFDFESNHNGDLV